MNRRLLRCERRSGTFPACELGRERTSTRTFTASPCQAKTAVASSFAHGSRTREALPWTPVRQLNADPPPLGAPGTTEDRGIMEVCPLKTPTSIGPTTPLSSDRSAACPFSQPTRTIVRLPKDLAAQALRKWQRANSRGTSATRIPSGTRAVRHRAGTLGLIGLAIEQRGVQDGDEFIVELDAWEIGNALEAADDMDC